MYLDLKKLISDIKYTDADLLKMIFKGVVEQMEDASITDGQNLLTGDNLYYSVNIDGNHNNSKLHMTSYLKQKDNYAVWIVIECKDENEAIEILDELSGVK